LLVEGKVVLGVMACPKLPLASTAGNALKSLPEKVGCLFYGSVGNGTYVQSLSVDSLPVKVNYLKPLCFHAFTIKSFHILLKK